MFSVKGARSDELQALYEEYSTAPAKQLLPNGFATFPQQQVIRPLFLRLFLDTILQVAFCSRLLLIEFLPPPQTPQTVGQGPK